MTSCRFGEVGCNQLDVMPVRLGFRRDLQLACSGCRASISQVVTVVERRVTTRPHPGGRDRRRFIPAWLRGRDLSRDETGAVLR